MLTEEIEDRSRSHHIGDSAVEKTQSKAYPLTYWQLYIHAILHFSGPKSVNRLGSNATHRGGLMRHQAQQDKFR